MRVNPLTETTAAEGLSWWLAKDYNINLPRDKRVEHEQYAVPGIP